VPLSSEVLVRVTHAGLNPADLIQRAGNYPAPPGSPADIPGLEVAGTVIACGESVTTWRAGDRVFGLVGGGGLSDTVAVHERHVARIPDNLTDREAAAVPEAFITAHDAVFTRAGLAMGETLLVNGASGGVGTAAVQLGAATGARVLANSRSHSDALVDLGAEPCPLSEARGVDVVLELVGAANLQASLEALAVRGRIIVVGTGAGADAEISLRALMGRRASLMGTVLRARHMEEKAAAVQVFARSVVPQIASGRVRPVIDRVFPVAEAAAAFDHLAAPGKLGKVLLELA
jgi:NADPH:quinone reductase-like Zn-dependent oxidoreductase